MENRNRNSLHENIRRNGRVIEPCKGSDGGMKA